MTTFLAAGVVFLFVYDRHSTPAPSNSAFPDHPLPKIDTSRVDYDAEFERWKELNKFKPKGRPVPVAGGRAAAGRKKLKEQEIVPEDDPKNPKGFLGDIQEVDSDDERYAFSGEKPKVGAPSRKGLNVSPDTSRYNNFPVVKTENRPYAQVPLHFKERKIVPLEFRIYSHNVKNGGHEVLGPGEEPWADRFGKIVASLRFNTARNSIVALQECYKFQLDDILADLNRFSPKGSPEWLAYGAGRIDGKEEGEYVPILYRNDDWDLVFSDTLWLNEKDPRSSLEGWDAKYLRIVSYVTLKHKQSGNFVNVFNSHFDHYGPVARVGSAQLIATKMDEINGWPSFLCGDLNAELNDKSYKYLSSKLRDLAKLATVYNSYGHLKLTVTGFGGEMLLGDGQNIDYIFAPKYAIKITQKPDCDAYYDKEKDKKKEPAAAHVFLQLRQFAMLHSKFNGLYMSDHRPIVADFLLGPNNC